MSHSTPAVDLAIVNCTVFDGASVELRRGPVLISGDRILAVGEVAPEDVERIDASGGTVIPGLIDAHFHAYATSTRPIEIESQPLSYIALAAAQRLGSALRRGFTSVRDVAGGDPGLARALDEGLAVAPRYLYTGPALSQTGGHGDLRLSEWERGIWSPCCAMSEVVDGSDNLRAAARERFRRGAHAIKIMTSGGVASPTDPIRVPQFSAEEIRAVTEEAVRRGSYVAAHAYSPEAIRHSILNGVRSIEHGNLLDQETAHMMAEHEAFLVPTLIAYDAIDRRGEELGLPEVSLAKNRDVLSAGSASVAVARSAGVKVGFGSDLMGQFETDQLLGLRLQVQASSAFETLRSATSVNADLLQRPDLGRITEGARADLLVLERDPLTDPSVLWNESHSRIVIRGGHRVPPLPDPA